MSGLEGVAKMTGSLVLLDGLSVAMAKIEEIRDILTQINIETGCYNSVQSLKLWLVMATLNTAVQVHLLNTQLRSNPKLVDQLRQQQQPPPVQMKVGEGNPQAREEEGKLFIKHRAQLISGWNSQNMGIGIPEESHCFHLPLPA